MSNRADDATARMARIDPTRPHSARMWNYWLGGKDNYAPDREAGDMIKEVFPDIVAVARHSRVFLGRAVRFLAAEAGIRQFLDIGTGLPTVDNTHELAQRIAPASRIVYADNDPLVLAHAQALLTSTDEGATAYVDADVHDPESLLRQAAETLDLTRPVGLMMLGILGHITDYDEARSVARRLVGALPAGSYLVVNDGTNTVTPDERNEATRILMDVMRVPYLPRTPEQIAGFFEGLELVEPGVVSSPLWRPGPDAVGRAGAADVYCGVGRKP